MNYYKEAADYLEAEKELGIDLVDLFYALKYGIQIISDDGKLVYHDRVKQIYYSGKNWMLETSFSEECFCFEDYGTVWAITEEELTCRD